MHCQILFEGVITFAIAIAFITLLLLVMLKFEVGLHAMYLKSSKMYVQAANEINTSITPFADFKVIIEK
jgi:hypothetical protein